MKLEMKKLFILLLTVVLMISFSLFTVSCKESVAQEVVTETEVETEEAAETTEISEEETITEEPVKFKDEIIGVVTHEPKSLDPIYGDAPGVDQHVLNLFYETLIRIVDGEIIPLLAESYTISDSYLDIVFKLREGIKFHDGTDFNAEAVKWNLDRARTDTESYYFSEMAVIKEVVVVDEYTVEIKLSEPNAPIISTLTASAGSIVSPTAAKKFGEDFHRNPVGTGPYVFVDWIGGERVIGERFTDYWRSDVDGIQLPYSDKAIVRFISENAVALIELQSGNVDLVENNLPSDFEIVEADPNLQVFSSPMGIHQWITFNVTAEPFNNEKLRQAFSAAIDRETIMKVITLGYGQVTPTLVPPGEWIYNGDIVNPYAYDPELSKTLLSEAGYPDGIEVTISVIQRDPDIQIAELIQAQLKEVGIKINVEILERQAWVDKVLGRSFEMATLRIGVPRVEPNQIFEISFGSAEAGQNWAGFDNPEIFDLVKQAKQNLNADERYDLYTEIQELLLDNAYFCFLFLRPQMTLATNDVTDVAYTIGGALNLGEIKVVVK